MKKLAIALALFAFPTLGDVTTSITSTDAQADRIARAIKRVNRETCAYRGLPVSCTTTQVRRQFCKTNGIGGQPILDKDGKQTGTTPLASDCPGATQFIVYPSVEAFAKRELLRLSAEQHASAEAAEDAAAAKAAFDAKTVAEHDAICASLGLAAGCSPF